MVNKAKGFWRLDAYVDLQQYGMESRNPRAGQDFFLSTHGFFFSSQVFARTLFLCDTTCCVY